jgi:hypothetical protein
MRASPFASVVLFFAAMVGSVVGQGLWEPSDMMKILDPVPKSSVPRELVTRLRVGTANVVLEQTALKEVQALLGGTIGHRGDAGEYLQWICVHGADPSGRWALWLESGETHGDAIGAFVLRRIPALGHVDERCSTLSQTSQSVTLPVPLQLGASEGEVIKVLGRPTVRHNDILFYVHEHEELLRGETFSTSNIVAVAVRRGIVEAIQVSRVTVN